MSRTIPIFAIALLSAVLVWMVYFWNPASSPLSSHERLGLSARPVGGDFRLSAADEPFDLSDLRGQVSLVYFGYTACPDICPTNLAIIALALRALTPRELGRVQVVFVSVDPERDSTERLNEYVGFFHPSIIGVTGTPEEIAGAAAQYGAAYRRAEQPESAMGYTVDHSAHTYVVNPSGELVEVLDHATPAEEIVATLRRHLDQSAG